MSEKNEDQFISFRVVDEIDALLGMKLIDRWLYVVLRKHMDKETKTVGQKYSVTRHELMSQLQEEYVPKSNKKPDKVTIDKFREAIKRLEKKGFVVIRSIATKMDKMFICELPKAYVPKSKKNMNPRRTPEHEPLSGSIDISNIEGVSTPNEPPSMNPRSQEVNNINNSNELFIESLQTKKSSKMKQEKKTRAKLKTTISDDFVVTDAHIVYATKHDLPAPASEIEKFINYYQSSGKLCANWDAAFRNWLIKAKEFSNAKSTVSTSSGSGYQSRPSAQQSRFNEYTKTTTDASREILDAYSRERISEGGQDFFENDSDI